MKEAWVHLQEWSREMITTALENGADALVIQAGWQEKVKALGRIVTVGEDGDLKPGAEVFFEVLRSPEDEARIAGLLHRATVVLEPFLADGPRERPWEVIPLENLVAHGGRLLVPVHSLEEVDLALGILEKGVAGVVIHARGPWELKSLLHRVKALSENAGLETAIIESIQAVGLGDRVCVDTCTLMHHGEGILVGSSSGFLFHVQAEWKANPYVAPRPFRVNAGAVHAYVRMPGGGTRYLSELKAGDPVLVVRAQGTTQVAAVGRVKIERRPLLLVEAVCGETRGSILLQNAETIRLTRPDGEALSVAELKTGDRVLVALEEAGRHFGMKVEESIIER